MRNFIQESLFILSCIFGAIGIMGLTFVYFNGIDENAIWYMGSMICAIILSCAYIIMMNFVRRKNFKKEN